MTGRDDFTKPVVRALAARAGNRCSNPDCRRETSGPDSTLEGSVNIGVAAHITAAAPGGPRFDAQLTAAERSALANGVWLCQVCGKAIDSDVARFPAALLVGWRTDAEARARERLEVPERPERVDQPVLSIPTTSPLSSWLPFAARSTTFVGREDERDRLSRFLQVDRKFAWWLVSGPGGTGKSRLALELCRDVQPGWYAGFLGRDSSVPRWSHYRPSRPTLIVVDYVASRAREISGMVLELGRAAAFLPHPVRVILLERDLGSWWSRFLRDESASESIELTESQYDEPMRLGPLPPEALRALAAEVAAAHHLPWSDAAGRAFQSRIRTLDPLGRPLFGMILAGYRGADGADAIADSTVLKLVIKKETARWRTLISDDDKLRRMENLAALATLVGGLRSRSAEPISLSGMDVVKLLPDLELLDHATYEELVGAANTDGTLSGVQPDIVGERFVLDRLAANAQTAANTKRLVAAAWSLQPNDFCDFVVRAASDFPHDSVLDVLCDVEIDDPESRALWGRLVSDLVRVAGRSSDPRTQRLLSKLRELADQHSDERALQAEAARGELYLGNVFLFGEDDPKRAAAQFDAAITRAGHGSEIAAAATNNRGILYHELEQEDRAFVDWSTVIDQPGVSDEARACSLNNRADIFARRGAHESAIDDRSRVLALSDTSPDRRYIALIRRSRSYSAVGKTEAALKDLGAILETADIAPEQKGEARLLRSSIHEELGQLDDAANDLVAVLESEALFPGTEPSALVRLADLARREQNPDRARDLLAAAGALPDTTAETLVEILVGCV